MSNLGKIARLAALAGLVLGLSACHYYAPYYGPPGHHGYYGHGGHGGHGHHGRGDRDDNNNNNNNNNNNGPYLPRGT